MPFLICILGDREQRVDSIHERDLRIDDYTLIYDVTEGSATAEIHRSVEHPDVSSYAEEAIDRLLENVGREGEPVFEIAIFDGEIFNGPDYDRFRADDPRWETGVSKNYNWLAADAASNAERILDGKESYWERRMASSVDSG